MLVISSFAVTDAFASVINVININFQGLRGIRTQVYFESANASAASSPVAVNTAGAVPSTSSSYRISPGASVYLWTTPFSTSTSLPASKMTLDIWAASTPEINGQATMAVKNRASSGSVTLSTNQTNDLIYVVVSVDDPVAPVSISGGGLTWFQRGNATADTGRVYAFYAISPSALTAATITATITGSTEYFVLTAFAISGIDTAHPFDSNLPTPAKANGESTSASVSFNTATKNDFLVGALYINGEPKTNIIGPGFTGISVLSSGKMIGATEYRNVATAGSHTVTFSFGLSSQSWSMIGDALAPASSGAVIKVSAYTTTSNGIIQNTLFSNQDANPTPQEGGQVATTFSTSAGTIPASGYLLVNLTAPTTSTMIVSWGSGQPTNVQICTAYSSPV